MISHLMTCKQSRAQFKICQVKSHVQTYESHDLDMTFCSFDNGFKQLRATNSMQEWYLLHRQSAQTHPSIGC